MRSFQKKTLNNWTRSAANANDENIIVTNNPAMVKSFAEKFQEIWTKFR